MQGLMITAYVGTPVYTGTHFDAINLDSVLAYAATSHLPPLTQGEARIVEIPGLKKVWQDADGKPLWACSMLYAIHPESGQEYAHRRYPSHRAKLAKKQSANLSAGQYKEGRRAIRATDARIWKAMAIGDAGIIRNLLSKVAHIGSRASIYGHVIRWDVEPYESVTLDAVLERRPVPAAFTPCDTPDPLAAWTPPYWYHPWMGPCRRPKDVFE